VLEQRVGVLLLEALRREGDAGLGHLPVVDGPAVPGHRRRGGERVARLRELTAKSGGGGRGGGRGIHRQPPTLLKFTLKDRKRKNTEDVTAGTRTPSAQRPSLSLFHERREEEEETWGRAGRQLAF